MLTLEFRNPTPNGVYPPGQSGNVQVGILARGLVVPWSMQVQLLDAQNIKVWEGQADIDGWEASVNLTWPTVAGVYTACAQCFNPMGNQIAEARTTFTVRNATPSI